MVPKPDQQQYYRYSSNASLGNEEECELGGPDDDELLTIVPSACWTEQARDYVVSLQFKELIASLTFFLLCNAVFWFDWGMTERPIPYQFTSSGEYIVDQTFNHKYLGETVPGDLHKMLLHIPVILQVLLAAFTRNYNDVNRTGCVYLIAMGLTELATHSLKLYVGYFRPVFYDGCKPNDDYSACTNEHHGSFRNSFPSSHASTTFCVATLLMLYIQKRFGVKSQKRYIRNKTTTSCDGVSGDEPNKFIVVVEYATEDSGFLPKIVSMLSLLPIAAALFVASSRIVDNMHAPADVIAGSLLGAFAASFSHGLWFA